MLAQRVESCLPVANLLLHICKFSVVTVCLKNVLFIIEFHFVSAKLSSCMDQLHSILGETLHEPTAVTAVLQSNFDLERALDQILSQGNKTNTLIKQINRFPQDLSVPVHFFYLKVTWPVLRDKKVLLIATV